MKMVNERAAKDQMQKEVEPAPVKLQPDNYKHSDLRPSVMVSPEEVISMDHTPIVTTRQTSSEEKAAELDRIRQAVLRDADNERIRREAVVKKLEDDKKLSRELAELAQIEQKQREEAAFLRQAREALEEQIRGDENAPPPAPPRKQKEPESDEEDLDGSKPVLETPKHHATLSEPPSVSNASPQSCGPVQSRTTRSLSNDFLEVVENKELQDQRSVLLSAELDSSHASASAVVAKFSFGPGTVPGDYDWVGCFPAEAVSRLSTSLPDQSSCLCWEWVSKAVSSADNDNNKELHLTLHSACPCGKVTENYSCMT
jgi:hypothetical protein